MDVDNIYIITNIFGHFRGAAYLLSQRSVD